MKGEASTTCMILIYVLVKPIVTVLYTKCDGKTEEWDKNTRENCLGHEEYI